MKYFNVQSKITGILFLGVLLLSPEASFSQESRNNCIECHSKFEEEDTSPTVRFKNDVHNESGISCSDCHGGDREIETNGENHLAMDPKKGFKKPPKRSEVPEFCARCHSDFDYMKKFNPNIRVDQYENYLTSQHSKLLVKGDEKVANCVSCHGAHGVKRKSDSSSPVFASQVPETCGKCHSDPEYMKEYGIPTDQLKKYKESVHGEYLLEKGDLGAPACNDCHGNHGAVPPGIESIHNVCGVCHTGNNQLFQSSTHRKYFDELDMPECVSCHDHHLIKILTEEALGTGSRSVCGKCHSEDDKGGAVANGIKNRIGNLSALMDTCLILTEEVEKKGMPVIDIKYQMNTINTQLLKARNMVHSFSFEEIKRITEKGTKSALNIKEMAYAAFKEYQNRRIGLAVSLLFIFLVGIVLYLKIREIDKKKKELNNAKTDKE